MQLPDEADHDPQKCGRVLFGESPDHLATTPLPDREQVVDISFPQEVTWRPT